MILDYAVAILLWLSMIIYANSGGADFGGGFWQMLIFSKGEQAKQERELITQAVGPIWEADNVWLIFLSVGLFTAFPIAAATLAISLFIPISLALLGIVMRGAGFAFEEASHSQTVHVLFGRVFSAASIIAPFLLGASAAAVASGDLRFKNGHPPVAVIGAWLTPFAIFVGLMGVGVCATLAAVYLTVEAERRNKPDLIEAYRIRALISGAVTAALAAVALGLAPFEATTLWNGMLAHGLWAMAITLVLGVITAAALFFRRFRAARILVALETAGIIGTWGVAQIPYIIVPNLTITGAASPYPMMVAFFASALVGMVILLPSFWLLMHTFKVERQLPPVHEKGVKV